MSEKNVPPGVITEARVEYGRINDVGKDDGDGAVSGPCGREVGTLSPNCLLQLLEADREREAPYLLVRLSKGQVVLHDLPLISLEMKNGGQPGFTSRLAESNRDARRCPPNRSLLPRLNRSRLETVRPRLLKLTLPDRERLFAMPPLLRVGSN